MNNSNIRSLINFFKKKNPIHDCYKMGHIIERCYFMSSCTATGCYACKKCDFSVKDTDLTPEQEKQYWNKAVNTSGVKE